MNSFPRDVTSAHGQVRITAIKAIQTSSMATLIRIDTDAGVSGYGPCGASGPRARAALDEWRHGRLAKLYPLGKDPLAIEVHFFNMFYACPQFDREMRVLSGIDIALWDLAGKLLDLPVSRLLGGPFRDEIPLYSHCSGGDVLSRDFWHERARQLIDDPRGFRAYKIDINHPIGAPAGQHIPSLSSQDVRNIATSYGLAREALGDEIDIIVHCHNELDVTSAIKVAHALEPIEPLFFEDALAPAFSEGWLTLKRSTRIPILTGENIELAEGALPFLQQQAVSCLQPDLLHAGGITGTKRIADLAAIFRLPICLHNVSGLVLDMASQQFSAAIHNCPMMECRRDAWQAPAAAANKPVIQNGRMQVSTLPGLGLVLDQDYLKSTLLPGEPWWDELD